MDTSRIYFLWKWTNSEKHFPKIDCRIDISQTENYERKNLTEPNLTREKTKKNYEKKCKKSCKIKKKMKKKLKNEKKHEKNENIIKKGKNHGRMKNL